MVNNLTIAAEDDVEVFSGSLIDVINSLDLIDQRKNVKVAAITCAGITDAQASAIAKAIRESREVRRYLSGDVDEDFYEAIVNACIPKKVCAPLLLSQAKLSAAKKIEVDEIAKLRR